MTEVSEYEFMKTPNLKIRNALQSYNSLKNDKKNVPEPETSLSSKNSTLQSSEDVFCMSAESYQDITNNDSVSYELANDEADMGNSRNAGSSKGSNTIVPPFFNNQSTPKKRSFVTKEKTIAEVFSPDGEAEEIDDQLFNSCPDTPCGQSIICIIDQQAPSRSLSMTEVSEYEFIKTPNLKIRNALKRYNSLKNVVRNSFRKSKSFIKKKGKRLSTSLNISMSNATASSDKQSCTDSIINLEDLLTVNESATVSEQLAQTVSICRQFPDLEISMEMVEAERLLLFSALRRENQLTFSSTATKNHMPHMRFFIDDMFLPVVSDGNQDIFFNYFYIVTFECGGIIKSTKSSECMNGIAVFRDNGIEFVQCTELETDGINEMKKNAVKCNIFMLRLRKISTVSIEPNQKTIIEALTKTPSPTLKSTSSSSTSSSSLNEIVSRFRLHASFTLDAKDFMPYEYVQQESVNSDRICLRASCLCTLPLTTQRKSTNLSGQLRLKGRAEMRFPKHAFNGFLNVKDPQKQHYWNRRWCTLDGIFLHVWQDQNSLCTSPLLVIDLRDSKNNMDCPLTCSSRELCARPHSFSLVCKIDIPCENTSTVFFGADTQENVDDWLKNLNTVLDFITTWLC